MGFFKDMIAVFKKRELGFIERIQESDDVYSFIFEKDKTLTWQAGQYGLFSIAHKSIKNPTKPFSIAAAPAEQVVRLTTVIRDQPSEFKQALMELKQGMAVKMSGPVGHFNVDTSSPALLVAGGIGITPFRAILKQMEAVGRRGENPIHLLYLDSDREHVFREELDGISENLSIGISYLDSKEQLYQEIDSFNKQHKHAGKYSLAGPKSMIDSLADHLQKHEVLKKSIKMDSFFGY